MRRGVWRAVIGLLLVSACSDGDARGEAERPPVDERPGTEVGAADPASLADVRLRGSVAQVIDGPLRLCASSTPATCLDSIELTNVTWDDMPVVPWQETWGAWNPDRVEIDGAIRADGRVVVSSVRRETVVQPTDVPCPGRTSDYPVVGGLSFDDVRRAIVDYTLTIGDRLGGDLSFDSRRGITIVRVVDDPAPHQEALDAVVPGRTCVIQAGNSRNDLGTLRNRLLELVGVWSDRGYGDAKVSERTEANLVVVSVPRIDHRFWDDVADDAHLAWVQAQVEVLGDDVADALAELPTARLDADADRLFVACRDVPIDPSVFEEPPDDHLDEHASTAVFDQTAMPGVPPPGDPTGWWRAYESPVRVLYVNADFGALTVLRRDDTWVWAGSGSCQLATADPLGMVVMSWVVDSDAVLEAHEVGLLVRTRGCPSTSPEDLAAPVDETDTTVTITVLRQPSAVGRPRAANSSTLDRWTCRSPSGSTGRSASGSCSTAAPTRRCPPDSRLSSGGGSRRVGSRWVRARSRARHRSRRGVAASAGRHGARRRWSARTR